jgi:hypothetical protein
LGLPGSSSCRVNDVMAALKVSNASDLGSIIFILNGLI